MSYFLRAAALAGLLVLAGCQSAPVQEMSDARQAISVAKKAGAEERAPQDLQTAMDYLDSAESFINERRYDKARRDAVSAKASALDALRASSDKTSDP
jgi:PBP1b-binding outer membrane lipoprotein LpoB